MKAEVKRHSSSSAAKFELAASVCFQEIPTIHLRNLERRSIFMGDKPQIESPKNVEVRDCLTVARNNIATELPGNSSLQREGTVAVDSANIVDMKRQRSDSSQSPALKKSASSGCKSEHLVYTRRKLEMEHGKPNGRLRLAIDDSKKSKDLISCRKEHPDGLTEGAHVSTLPSLSTFQPTCGVISMLPSFSTNQPISEAPTVASIGPSSLSPGTPTSDAPVLGFSESAVTKGSPSLVNHHERSNVDWKNRSLQLQASLKACDQSCQEYIKRFRSLSPVGRSKLAVELEERTIHLLLEEGKELHLMRVLNIFGKDSSIDQIVQSVDKLSSLHGE